MPRIALDSERARYIDWWPDLRRVLQRGGLLIVDNATSHREQKIPFVEVVRSAPNFATGLILIGMGEFLAVNLSL